MTTEITTSKQIWLKINELKSKSPIDYMFYLQSIQNRLYDESLILVDVDNSNQHIITEID